MMEVGMVETPRNKEYVVVFRKPHKNKKSRNRHLLIRIDLHKDYHDCWSCPFLVNGKTRCGEVCREIREYIGNLENYNIYQTSRFVINPKKLLVSDTQIPY